MNDVAIASTAADAAAVEAVEQHHAQLAGALTARVEELVTAAAAQDAAAASAARSGLAGWARAELVPHAQAEEKAMYPAAHARDEGRLLVEGMLAEHKTIVGLVDEVERAADATRAAAAAYALLVLFDSHLAKENEQILPLLAAAGDISVAGLLSGMHELLGGDGSEHAAGHRADCACGESDTGELPELDARGVAHAIRHATIFGALDAVRAGSGLVLVAPHDPLPLLAQLERRAPGAFRVSYLERGPDAWKLSFVRRPVPTPS